MNTILHAQEFSIPLPAVESGAALPEDIQWMPPGTQTGTFLDMSGKPATRTVHVHAGTAQRLAGVLQELRSRAASRQEDLPYIDFNHADAEAAAHVLEIFWGGDDPVKGGVRAKVRWTGPGRAALEGRAYRRFSPSFQRDEAGEVVGMPINMGGLVNRAAFKTIEPIWSRSGEATGGQVDQPKESDMDTAKQLADLQAANADLANQVSELNAKLATANQAETLKAKETEITALKAQIEALNAKLGDQAKANAKATVDAAVKAGKLAPQATDLHAKWIDAITANPALAETLNAMAPNPALGGTITGNAGGTTQTPPNKSGEFLQAIDAEVKAGKSKLEAFRAVRGKNPKLHQAWLEAGGGQL